jgi:hypothetical protein
LGPPKHGFSIDKRKLSDGLIWRHILLLRFARHTA